MTTLNRTLSSQTDIYKYENVTDRHFSVWHNNSKRKSLQHPPLNEGFTLKSDKENKTVNLQQQQHVTQQLVNYRLRTLSDWRAKLTQHVIVPTKVQAGSRPEIGAEWCSRSNIGPSSV